MSDDKDHPRNPHRFDPSPTRGEPSRAERELRNRIAEALIEWQQRAMGYQWLSGRTAHDIGLIADHVAARLSAK